MVAQKDKKKATWSANKREMPMMDNSSHDPMADQLGVESDDRKGKHLAGHWAG